MSDVFWTASRGVAEVSDVFCDRFREWLFKGIGLYLYNKLQLMELSIVDGYTRKHVGRWSVGCPHLGDNGRWRHPLGGCTH